MLVGYARVSTAEQNPDHQAPRGDDVQADAVKTFEAALHGNTQQ